LARPQGGRRLFPGHVCRHVRSCGGKGQERQGRPPHEPRAYNASLALYSTSYKNRLQTFAAPVAGTPLFESYYQNVGRIKAHGVELSGGYRPAFVSGLAFNGSLTYNVSKFQDNYTTQASATATPVLVTIKDKITPDSPKYMYQWGATYEPVSWAAVTLSGRYVGERYSNFINTEWTAGYVKWDASLDLGAGARPASAR